MLSGSRHLSSSAWLSTWLAAWKWLQNRSPQSPKVTLPLPCMWGSRSAGALSLYQVRIPWATAISGSQWSSTPPGTLLPSKKSHQLLLKGPFLGDKFQWNILKHNVTSPWWLELKEPLASESNPLILKTKRWNLAFQVLLKVTESELHLGLCAPCSVTAWPWSHTTETSGVIFLPLHGISWLLYESQKKKR